jgi:hypothetical protein
LRTLVVLSLLLGACSTGAPQTASTAPDATLAPTDTAAAVCQAYGDLWDLRNGEVLSIVNRLAAYLSSSTGEFDVAATNADLVTIARTTVHVAELIGSIKFPADPALIVDLKTSTAGYANGAAALHAWLDANGPTSNPYGVDVQSFTAGADALNSANQRVGQDFAAGTLPCDAHF